MASTPNLQTLIAHYLAVNYPNALPAFIEAAHVPEPDTANPPRPDLPSLVTEFYAIQASIDLSNIKLDEHEISHDGSWEGWTAKQVMKVELTADVKLGGVRRTLEGISAANLLTVGVQPVAKRVFDTSIAGFCSTYPLSIVTTSVDKSLRIIDYTTGEVESAIEPHKAAILCFAFHPLNSRYLLTGSMDGTTILTDLITAQPLQTFKSNKFVVRTVFSSNGKYMATASYDHSVVIYRTDTALVEVDEDDVLDDTDDPALAGQPSLRYKEVHRIKADSNPEAILFHPASTALLYTLRSSHLLYYVDLETWETKTKSFNPHPMDTHVSFSVLNMVLHPSGKLIAFQTGDNRGTAGERILFYGTDVEETDRLGCIWTGAEGDDFVMPRMDWLPDGTGLITTTTTGHLKLISISEGARNTVKIHGAVDLGQASSDVVRDCCVIQQGDDWEVVSVGFDRRVRISR